MRNSIEVKSEETRIASAVEYVDGMIEELNRVIIEYGINDYYEERHACKIELSKWEKMRELLTAKTPFTMITW